MLGRHGPNVPPPLVFVGDPGPAALATISALGIAGRVRVLRPVDDATLGRLYREAIAVVVPSVAEGFGLPALEGMGCGTPPIVARIGPLLALAAEVGETFDPRDPFGIARALDRISDRSTWRERSDRARARAAAFTWERTAIETARAYRETLARS